MKSQSTNHIARCVVILFGFILFVGGCATPTASFQVYKGQKRPQNEVVTLIVPTSLEVLAVDGKEIDVPYFGGNDYKLELLPGSHTLEVYYKESWGGPTSSAVVVSDVSKFRLSTEAGAIILLKHDGPRDLVTASRFSDMPKIWLIDPNTGRRLEPYATEKYIPALLRALRKYEAASQDTAAEITPGTSSTAVAEGVALKRLTFWWKLAEKRDREAFRQWLATGAPAEVTNKDAPAMKLQQPSSTALAEDVVMQQDALERLQFWWNVADAKDRNAFKGWLDQRALTE